jgi:hypothetical protein
MPGKYPEVAANVLKVVLRPLVKLWTRHGHSYQSFSAAAKELFISVAKEDLDKTKEKVNLSRLSLMTGLARSEVKRLLELDESSPAESETMLLRVMGQWRNDKRFSRSHEHPRELTYSGEDAEFKSLCKSVSKHLNPGTVLFELERKGLIEKGPETVKLIKQVFTVQPDPAKGYEFVAKDIEYLLTTVEQNLFLKRAASNLHIRTEYDNIYRVNIPAIRRWLVDEGKAYHKSAREYLSGLDKDVAPAASQDEAGAKVVLEVFAFTEPSE